MKFPDEHAKFSIGKRGVEKITYEHDPSKILGGYRGGRSKDGKGSSQFYKQNQKQTQCRRKRTIKELINNNFYDHLCSFATLTIDPAKFPFSMRLSPDSDREEQILKIVEVASEEFRKFIRRVKKRYSGHMIYLAVPELVISETRINLHFHMLIDLINWHEREAEELWGWGIVHTEDVYDVQGLSFYMTKSSFSEEYAFFGRKGYYASKGLLRNELVRSYFVEDFDKYCAILDELEDKEPTRTFETSNDFLGKVTYEHYNRDAGKAQIWDIDTDNEV